MAQSILASPGNRGLGDESEFKQEPPAETKSFIVCITGWQSAEQYAKPVCISERQFLLIAGSEGRERDWKMGAHSDINRCA
jgi:hypothetical protein